MIKETLRIVAGIFLIMIVAMDDFPFYKKIQTPYIQFFLAMGAVLCIFFDEWFGLIMTVNLLLIYYEIYKKAIIIYETNNLKQKKEDDLKNPDQEISQIDFLSAEHLHAAQNNIFDVNNYNTEVKGINVGFNNEDVYGSQGLDSENIMGFGEHTEYSAFNPE